VGDGHFIPNHTSPPLLWAQAEHTTQCGAEPEGSGGSFCNCDLQCVFPGMQNETHNGNYEYTDLVNYLFSSTHSKFWSLCFNLAVQKGNQNV
jgi:hypothetical protein